MAKIILRIFAILLIVSGLGWVGQGLGYINWPPHGFMVDQRPWAWRGLAVAAVGVALLILSLRRARP